jgi:hypothetical protein
MNWPAISTNILLASTTLRKSPLYDATVPTGLIDNCEVVYAANYD